MIVIKNKVQAVLISISVIILFLQYLCFNIFSLSQNNMIFLLLPFFLVCLIIAIENLITLKKNIIQYVSVFLCIVVILFLQIALGMVLMIGSFSTANIDKNDITDINRYPIIIKTIYSKQIRHFPKKIPEKGENIVFYCSKDSYFGGKIIFVKFDINSSYIKTALKKHKYITSDNTTKSMARGFVFYELLKQHLVNINDYKFYVIGNNSNTRNCHHSCEYGIAVNEKTNTIIYYASNPD